MKAMIHRVEQSAAHHFGFNAESEGAYTFCFSNVNANGRPRNFVFSSVGPDEHSKFSLKTNNAELTALEKEVEQELRALGEEVDKYRSEASYLMGRDFTHRNSSFYKETHIVEF
ncbi:hypothetical protein HK098_001257 [Nowakowskiella sp. JEL0407]|nr:hypothetical protein HK098_001257 [Nowakowskiella sp. JEL0407]